MSFDVSTQRSLSKISSVFAPPQPSLWKVKILHDRQTDRWLDICLCNWLRLRLKCGCCLLSYTTHPCSSEIIDQAAYKDGAVALKQEAMIGRLLPTNTSMAVWSIHEPFLSLRRFHSASQLKSRIPCPVFVSYTKLIQGWVFKTCNSNRSRTSHLRSCLG